MLDRDLAALYGVETKNLNKAVRRNVDRFPADFMFQLTSDEAECLRFQFGTLKRGQHFKYLPQVFTQEGVAMLSSVLRSPRAVQVNIAIMRVFVRLRQTLALHKELATRLTELETEDRRPRLRHPDAVRRDPRIGNSAGKSASCDRFSCEGRQPALSGEASPKNEFAL
jgi:hypothetical protein